jgi:prepilin-type N-terminal cleavage/methylation domain-containing protein
MSPAPRQLPPATLRAVARRSRGFTLIEAIIGMVILSVAIPPMLWAVRQAHLHRVGQLLASRARWLAQEGLEDVIADRHSNTRNYPYLAAANYPAESSIAGFPGFSRSVSFQETAADLSSPGTGYMKVTVTVSYTDAGAVSRFISLSTEITDYSP